MKQNELLRIIKSLGGDKTDLDLIDSKGDEIIKINEDELKNDLSKFMSQFDFSQYDDDTDEDQVYDEISSNESENEKEDGEEIDENDENATFSENNDADKPLLKESFSAKLLVDPTTPWHHQVQFTNRINDMVKLKMLKEKASFLYENEVKLFQKRKDSKSNKDFTAKVIKNGTTFDKISLFTLLIQESPVHQFKVLNDFFQKKPQKKQLVIIAESIKDLMINTILPDRKLKFFVDSCCSNPSEKDLILYYFEDLLKSQFFKYIQTLEGMLKDNLEFVKLKALNCVYELLVANPEEEGNLLALLVNKMGDLEKKVASKASFLAGQLLVKHPNMKKIVVQEVERLIKRPNITDRARYYAITFLNQIVLTMQNQELANHLISLYFSLFEILVHSIKKEPNNEPKKKNRHRDKGKKPELILDSVNSKLMAQLLLGVNRSFPFSNLDEKVFNSHLDTLFLITHISNFNTSIQALSLIFHVQSSKNQLTDRFYKALYDSLFDPRLIDQAKQSIYLNLLYRALKRDNKVDRVMAFVKRIIQMGTMANVPLVCASLFLIGELFEVFPALKNYLEAQKSDCSDTIKQLDNEIQDDDNMADANKSKNTYDAKARDPLYAHAEKSKLWDLVIFQNHFHPTVALYSKTILQGKKIELPPNSTNYDPLHNHTLQRFLDRIIQKAPKKVKTATKGESIMQPKLHHDSNIFTSKKRANFEFTDDDGNVFTSSHNAVDQEYLKNFIMKNDSKDKELDEDEIWDAMVTSKGFDKRGLDEDVDPEFDDLEFDYDSEDDDMQKWADEDNQCDVNGNDDEEQLSNGDEEIEWLDEEFKGIEKNYSDKYDDDGDENDKAGSESDEEFQNIENGELNDLNDSDLEEHLSKQLLCEEEEFDDQLNEESSDKSSKKSKRLKKDRMAKLASKLGYTGDFFMTKGSDFASAEDFELLQNMNSEEDETNITKRKSNTKFKKSKKQKK